MIQDKVYNLTKNGNWNLNKNIKNKKVWGEYFDHNKDCRQIWINFVYKGHEFSRCIDIALLDKEIKEDLK